MQQSTNVEPGPFFGTAAASTGFANVAPGALTYEATMSFDWRYDIQTVGTVSATPGL